MFNRPTLATIIARIAADIETQLPGVDARLRRHVVTVIGRSLAGAIHGLYGSLDDLSHQILPDTADAEHLDRWAAIWGVVRVPTAVAVGMVDLIGSDGNTLPAGSILQRGDGVEYTTDADATIAAGVATVAVTAIVAGTGGNALPATKLTIVNPIAGINSSSTVTVDALTGGAEPETDAALRTRLMARLHAPPHGGAMADYESWALEIAQVTRAWPFPLNRGNGTVDLYFVCDDLDPIIPDAAKVAEMQAHIDILRPVTANFLAVAPTPAPIAFTIATNPPTAAVKAAVEAELRDLLRREAIPGDGLDQGTILLSHIREAISIAAGEIDYLLTAPSADVTVAAGAMATMGVITWA